MFSSAMNYRVSQNTPPPSVTAQSQSGRTKAVTLWPCLQKITNVMAWELFPDTTNIGSLVLETKGATPICFIEIGLRLGDKIQNLRKITILQCVHL